MSKITQTILEKALSLSETERADLAARLIDSLDDGVDAGYARAWEAEIQKRVDEIDSGKVQTTPWSRVRARIRRA